MAKKTRVLAPVKPQPQVTFPHIGQKDGLVVHTILEDQIIVIDVGAFAFQGIDSKLLA